MNGARVIEVAEHGFVPGAGALLADWGAEVIKIEPSARGDAARGLTTAGSDGVEVLFEHANRGKRSLGLDLSMPEGRDILYKLVASADVFLTNKLPRVRKRLRVDVDDLRVHNPNLIYVRGTGQGELGPEADRGAYDLLTFWHRSGTSVAAAAPDGTIPFLPAPGYGDFIGSMFIAGGVMGALFHRERTGEAPVVDASLLSTGMWSMGVALATRAIDDTWKWPPANPNPLSAIYRTKDDRWLAFSCLQAGHYWGPLAEVIGRPELADDPRFRDHQSLLENNVAARAILREVFIEGTLSEWSERLAGFSGQWAVIQDTSEAVRDPQAAANGYLQELRTASGAPFTLVAAPVQFDGQPAKPGRAPEFNEHGDTILAELGLEWDEIVDLKVRGVVP
jgi:crotonobetainyl-CoA:carnitine CoA-transferase CaiB-like acyl-CoA transferase